MWKMNELVNNHSSILTKKVWKVIEGVKELLFHYRQIIKFFKLFSFITNHSSILAKKLWKVIKGVEEEEFYCVLPLPRNRKERGRRIEGKWL